MKILQIISGREVNGALVHCKLLSRELANRGHDVSVMCRDGSWIWDQLIDTRLETIENEMNRWPPRNLFRTASWVRRQQFDVVHTHMSRAHMFGVLLKWLTGVPVVATAHNRHFQPHWRFNDRVIANSEATRSFHRQFNRVREDQVETIHCFVDLNRFHNLNPQSRYRMRRQLRVHQDQTVIGIVGDVTARKGHQFLFRALPRLVEAFPDLKLVVVGRFKRSEAYVKRLRRFQLHNGLFQRVRWLGHRDNIPEVMSALDLLVVPSIEEPLGMVPIEAMATGTPVVATKTGGLPEVVKHEQTGLLVPTRSPRELANAAERLLQDAALRQRVTQQARQWVEHEFSPVRLSDRIELTLRRTAATRRAA